MQHRMPLARAAGSLSGRQHAGTALAAIELLSAPPSNPITSPTGGRSPQTISLVAIHWSRGHASATLAGISQAQ